MTRINVGVPPRELTQRHLIAEHREIKRIPNTVREGKFKSRPPDKFGLGTGHVLFFTDKLGYLLDRYRKIYAECIARGYNVTNYESCWDGLDLGKPWESTLGDVQLIRDRIAERLNNILT